MSAFLAYCLVATLLVVVLPGLVVRACVLMYPRYHPRRRELLAELQTVPPTARFLWSLSMVEAAVQEGLPIRASRPRHRFSFPMWVRRRLPLGLRLWCCYWDEKVIARRLDETDQAILQIHHLMRDADNERAARAVRRVWSKHVGTTKLIRRSRAEAEWFASQLDHPSRTRQ